MSDWEDFCESNGWNAGSEADYDTFLDSLEERLVKEFSENTFPRSPQKVFIFRLFRKPLIGRKITLERHSPEVLTVQNTPLKKRKVKEDEKLAA